jgi:hypothetical protein
MWKEIALIYRGFRPKPRLPFCLNTKRKQKSQDCARFTRKTDTQLAETVQTRSFVAQTGQFQTPTSLVFSCADRWFGSPDEVTHENAVCNSILFAFLLKISFKCIAGDINALLTSLWGMGYHKKNIRHYKVRIISTIKSIRNR